MSYCVNCGVELEASEKSCPLCSVVVNNPEKPWTEPQSRPYPTRVDKIMQQVNRNYGVGLASLILLIPSITTLIIDLLTIGSVTWSVYVIGSCFLAYVLILFPLLFQKPKIYLFIGLDAAALLAFLALIDGLNGFLWFATLAMPIVMVSTAITFVTALVIRRKNCPALSKAAWILISLSVFLVALEIIINANIMPRLLPQWSFYAAAPCIIISVILFYTEYHKELKEKIRRRLFY